MLNVRITWFDLLFVIVEWIFTIRSNECLFHALIRGPSPFFLFLLLSFDFFLCSRFSPPSQSCKPAYCASLICTINCGRFVCRPSLSLLALIPSISNPILFFFELHPFVILTRLNRSAISRNQTDSRTSWIGLRSHIKSLCLHFWRSFSWTSKLKHFRCVVFSFLPFTQTTFLRFTWKSADGSSTHRCLWFMIYGSFFTLFEWPPCRPFPYSSRVCLLPFRLRSSTCVDCLL